MTARLFGVEFTTINIESGLFYRMPGSFGLLSDPHSTHFPPDLLVERNLRVDVWYLDECGLLVEGAVGRLRWTDKMPWGGERSATHEVEILRRTPNVVIGGQPVLVTWQDPCRPWFECPKCQRRTRFMYYIRDGVACRICFKLDWSVRHLWRATPGIHQIAKWRRQIGAEPRPFAPIPPRPSHHKVFDRIVAKIQDEEAKLVGYLSTINCDLARRRRVRKQRKTW